MSGKSRTSRRAATGAASPGDPRAAKPADGPATESLLEKRDSFIHTFFKKGAELTEQLLREDDKLRVRLREVEAENAALRAQVASDDAIRDLLTKIAGLETEKRELLSRFRDAQA